MKDNYSNYGGYGFWCGKKCAERKIAVGIPPLGAKRAAQATEAGSDLMLAQAALEKTRNKDNAWSPVAVGGIVIGSLLTIAIMVVIIKKSKN